MNNILNRFKVPLIFHRWLGLVDDWFTMFCQGVDD
jgi:hypothetical protein